jgi:hypothetical protein
MMEIKQSGQSGGAGGETFLDDIRPQDYQITEVRIHAGQQVNAIQVTHETVDGQCHAFPLRGQAGDDCYVLALDADEYIVRVSGRCGTVVDSIRVQTNRQCSPLLGGDGGEVAYQYEAPPGIEIVGFCGRASEVVNAIGVLMRRRGL